MLIACPDDELQVSLTGTTPTSSNGLLAGTSSYLIRRHDQMNWAVLFNTHNAPDGKPVMTKIRDLSSAAFERMVRWPDLDQFQTLL